jgi:hypothetical protein
MHIHPFTLKEFLCVWVVGNVDASHYVLDVTNDESMHSLPLIGNNTASPILINNEPTIVQRHAVAMGNNKPLLLDAVATSMQIPVHTHRLSPV